MRDRSLKRKKISSSVFEFVTVVVVLYLLFLIVIDIGLYFRKVYVTQTASDEILARLQAENVCTSSSGPNFPELGNVLSDIIQTYYNVTPNMNITASGTIVNGYDIPNRFRFELTCRNAYVPDKLSFSHGHRGLLLFPRGHEIYIKAYPSNNIIYP